MKKTIGRNIYRGFSLMLCILLLILNTAMSVFSAETSLPDGNGIANAGGVLDKSDAITEDVLQESICKLGEGELSYAQLQKLSPKDVTLPETLTRVQAIEKGHVNRLCLQEKNLQSVLYQNRDGTKTAYVFSKPVKYIRDGVVKDKDTTIRTTGIAGYTYAMTENSFAVYFGSTVKKGVTLQYKDSILNMKPGIMKSESIPAESVGTGSIKPGVSLPLSKPTLGEDERTVIYPGAFGDQTALRYETQLSGVKEDIILLSDVGMDTFHFLLTILGATPMQKKNGGWSLVNEKQEEIIDFGDIVIKDSAGKTVYGTLDIVPQEPGSYTMTITVPQEFLQASDTVYPVYVDPTAVVREKAQSIEYDGGEAIVTEYDAIYDTLAVREDCWVYYNEGELPLNTSTFAWFFFTDFYLPYGQFVDLTQEQIDKATFYAQPLSCIETYVYTAAMYDDVPYVDPCWPDICNNNLFWSLNPELGSSQHVWVCGATDCTTGHCSDRNEPVVLDFTGIARSWARYNSGNSFDAHNPANGMAVYTGTVAPADLIASTEAPGGGNVYYEIDYNTAPDTYYIKNSFYHTTLKMVERYDCAVNMMEIYECEPGCIIDIHNKWIITGDKNGGYFHISNIDGNVKKYLGSISYGYYIPGYGYIDDRYLALTDEKTSWSIIHVSGGKYIIKSKYGDYLCQTNGGTLDMQSTFPNPSSPDYDKFLWELANVSSYKPLQSFAVSYDLWMGNSAAMSITDIVPSNAAWVSNQYFSYELQNKEDESRVYLWYDDETYECKVRIQEGLDYHNVNDSINVVVTYLLTGRKIVFPITIGKIIPNGVYHLNNQYSEKILNVPSVTISNGQIVQQAAYHTGKNAQWELNYNTSTGYYTIRSGLSTATTSYYLATTSSSTQGNPGVTLKTTLDDTCYWRITITSKGYYRITPKNALSYALSLSSKSTDDATAVSLKNYTNDSSLEDEWVIFYDASLLAFDDGSTGMGQSYDRSYYFDDSIDVLKTGSLTNSFLTQYKEYFSEQSIRHVMENSKTFIIHTHGNKTRFVRGDAPPESGEGYLRYTMTQMASTDLSNMNLVIYLTCNGAEGYVNEDNIINNTPQNLLEATRCAGAKTVIAFTEMTTVEVCNAWIVDLLNTMYNGGEQRTLGQALIKLNENSWETYNYTIDPTEDYPGGSFNLLDVCVVSGDKDIYLSDLFT